MSKTPEQVAQDACSICWINMPGSVDWPAQCASIVSALRSAGWLRSSPWVESASEERIATLTRERDEARTNAAQAVGQLDLAQRERDEARVDREAWARAYRRALASAASPEVMRVVEAAEAIGKHPACEVRNFPPLLINNLRDAVDALSASRQPKAQEPRYYVSGNEVRERLHSPENYRTSAAFYGPNHVARAEAECARLNGEGGAS